MFEQNKALLRRWFQEVWNEGKETTIDELFIPDGVAHGLSKESGKQLQGPAAFKPFWRAFRSAFPDIRVTVEELIAEGDLAVARCIVRGAHTGHGLGFAPTHCSVEFSGVTIIRVRDGKIVEGWNNFDFLALYQQIGLIPTPRNLTTP
jgi:predicted ester cyclase